MNKEKKSGMYIPFWFTCRHDHHANHSIKNTNKIIFATILVFVFFTRLCLCAPYDITMNSPHEYDGEKGGRNNIVSGIDDWHYLCLYAGYSGMAVILTVNPGDWSITTETSYQYDEDGDYMGLSRIDTDHYLCTYCGGYEQAFASVLSLNLADWSITKESTMMYDIEFGYYNALSRIDDTHYLGVHNKMDVTGSACVFTVDPSSWAITYGTEDHFETESGFDFMLLRIDNTHHFCVYPSQYEGYTGRAVVLVVDQNNWTVDPATYPVTYATDSDAYSFLSRIDDNHFLCAYQGPDSDGWAVVLTVNTMYWSISIETPYEYDTQLGGEPNLARIDSTHFLCAYKGADADGYAVVLTVDTSNWVIHKETSFEFDETRADYPYLCKIDDAHYLCSYEGPESDGWAVVLDVELPGIGVDENDNVPDDMVFSNYPNPFADETTISFYSTANVHELDHITIYNIKGEVVTTLNLEASDSGLSTIWDGKDDSGKSVSNGIYFYKFKAGDIERTHKLILMR